MLDPLEHLDRFAPHGGPVIDLSDVTSITVDDRMDADTTKRLASITKWHRRFIRFGREIIVSGSRPDVDKVDWVKAERWRGYALHAYSRWCQKELPDHFSTPRVMIWQADGFAINPHLWSADFLKYDYIGAPMANGVVGNGGFCMRSKRFCEQARNLPDCGAVWEDWFFCVIQRGALEAAGMRFAPYHVALRWSYGYRSDDLSGHFGFHSKSSVPAAAAILNRQIDHRKPVRLSEGVIWDGARIVKSEHYRGG